jgi:hypothetical protein
MITAAGLVVSIVVSLLLPNYYKSTEIFYPYSLESLDPKNIISEEVAEVFGKNSDVERLKQIGSSGQLTGYMVWKFDLYKRYDIDPQSQLGGYYVFKKFQSNYNIIKNDMGALEVSVMDKDPKIAAVMASEVVKYLDSVNKQSFLENNAKIYNALEITLNQKYKELTGLEDALKGNNGENGDELTVHSILAKKSSSEVDAKLMENLLQTIDLKEKFTQIKAFLAGNFKTIFIIEKATPSVVKAKPVRWLIVVASTFLTFFLTIIALLLIEFYKSNLKEILKNAE